jgi:hypothetical protein
MLSTNADQVATDTIERFDTFEERVDDELERTAEDAKGRARERVPVDEGDLLRDISVRTGEGWSKVFNTLDYAVYQNFGTEGPYIIEPKRAQALRFTVDGETVFAKAVLHPGVPATYYMTDAALDAFIDSIDRLTR